MWKRKENKSNAFAEAMLEYLDQLFGTALRLTANRAEAEDLVQDTLVRAMRFQERFEPGTNLRAWLFRIMVNLFATRFRHERRGREIQCGPEKEDLLSNLAPGYRDSADPQPEEFFFEKVLSDDVVAAINELPAEFKVVVLLRDLNGFSYAQIADILEIPVGTVMSRLFRARQQLRSRLFQYALSQGYIRTGETGTEKVTRLDEYRSRQAGGREP
ncbi:MAG: sigma-70 family RNA polymerase sigma factor [Myxococcales bacterium]|nr:sigma-70 family RNA polymerase sigma factor [Myxococcales bacterium]